MSAAPPRGTSQFRAIKHHPHHLDLANPNGAGVFVLLSSTHTLSLRYSVKIVYVGQNAPRAAVYVYTLPFSIDILIDI